MTDSFFPKKRFHSSRFLLVSSGLIQRNREDLLELNEHFCDFVLRGELRKFLKHSWRSICYMRRTEDIFKRNCAQYLISVWNQTVCATELYFSNVCPKKGLLTDVWIWAGEYRSLLKCSLKPASWFLSYTLTSLGVLLQGIVVLNMTFYT